MAVRTARRLDSVTALAATERQPDGDVDGGGRRSRAMTVHDTTIPPRADDPLTRARTSSVGERVDHASARRGRAAVSWPPSPTCAATRPAVAGEREHPDGEDDDRDQELDDGEAGAHGREDA